MQSKKYYQHNSCRWLFKLFIIINIIKYCHSFCPSKCTCAGELNLRASCISADLEVVPIQLNPDSKYINLTLNKIQNVDFTLTFYTQLEVLDLSQNHIEMLGSKNFEVQNKLRTLNLSHNSLSIIKKDAFKGLGNLLLLDLSYNHIELINMNSMNDLNSLMELDLTNNFIISIDDGVFKNMISLEILMIKNNQLLDIPVNNLEHLKSLKSLDLSDNLIEYIRNESFESLKDLVMLSLSGNVISELDIGAFDGLVGLKHMDIADNNLTIVPTQQLSKLSNLTYLSLSGNRFTHIPAVALLNLFHLRELHMDRLDRLIKIDSRAFVDNTYLQILNLNNNPQFSELPLRLFHGNPNLMEISMQGNNLMTLDAAQFPIDRIQRLQLGNNPLQCNCSILWLWRLVTGNYDDTGNTISSLSSSSSSAVSENLTLNFLTLDSDHIGCDIWQDQIKIRRILRTMDENEMTCPAHIVTIVCAILSSLVVLMTGASILFYLRFVKRRRKLFNDRRNGKNVVNVNDHIIQHHHQHLHHQQNHLNHNSNQQQVDKLELERYLAAQAIANEYRALKPWELPIKESIDESEHHYEKFDHYDYPDTRPMAKPHVVYV